MNLRDLALYQIDSEEYNKLRRYFPWPTSYIKDDGSTGFAKISNRPVFPNARIMLDEFSQHRFSRRVSVKRKEKGWKRVKVEDFNDENIADVLEIAENSRNLIYLGFRNGLMGDHEVNFEIGFAPDSRGVMTSVCACVPGHLRGRDFTWYGTADELVEIYGLV